MKFFTTKRIAIAVFTTIFLIVVYEFRKRYKTLWGVETAAALAALHALSTGIIYIEKLMDLIFEEAEVLV